MINVNFLRKTLIFFLFMILFFSITISALEEDPIIKINSPLDGKSYLEYQTLIEFEIQHEYDMGITLVNFTPTSPKMICRYILNNQQEIIIPCGVGNNSYFGLQTIEGKNILEIFTRDEMGKIGSNKIEFTINFENDKKTNCCCKSNFYFEEDSLDEFYYNQSLEDDMKRKRIFLNDAIGEQVKLTCWQKFVNWVGSLFDWSPAYK